MEQRPSWHADCFLGYSTNSRHFVEPEEP